MSGTKNKGAEVFETKDKPDGPTHELFNRGSGDGGNHGHRVTDTDTGDTKYVRDNDGDVYVDDSKTE